MKTVDLATSESVLSLLGDPTRVRLLSLLVGEELTVAELTAITGLAQSRVSTHLGRLREAGLLRDRKAGASTFYRLNDGGMPVEALRVWELVRGTVDDPLLEADLARRADVLAAREGGWPDRIAGQMERHYSPGRTWEALARAFLALVEAGDVLDVGTGDGTVAELIAPRARSLTGLEKSERLLGAARARLVGAKNVTLASGDMHEMPFRDASFDLVLLLNVLAYTRTPKRVVGEAARVLRPSGRLLVTTLAPHENRDITDGYGHANAGIAPSALRRALSGAGLTPISCEVTSRERKKPHFRVITAIATKERS
jgi:ArsR family transcriptional regulator